MLVFIDRKGGSILVAGYKMLYILSFSAQIFEVTVYFTSIYNIVFEQECQNICLKNQFPNKYKEFIEAFWKKIMFFSKK